MSYIKLGPIGDYFGSSRLGLYLTPGNAAQIDDGILYSTLSKFLLTGFFVLIDKHEFENIKIDRRAIRGIPLQFVGVNQPTIIEPVIDYLNSPPADATIGDRYIIGNNPTGVWSNLRGMVVQFTGNDSDNPWQQIRPKEGNIIPIYNLGISTTYTGTYPSGSWNLTDRRINELKVSFNEILESDSEDDIPWATRAWVTQQINIEANNRIDGYVYLLQIIQNIQSTPQTQNKAVNVSIEDLGNYFQANNVEMALMELGSDLKTTKENLGTLTLAYQQLSNQVQQLIGSGGGSGSSFSTRAYLYLGVTSINLGHLMGRIPIWQLYKFTPTGSDTVSANTVLSGVIAQPYRLTYNDIRFEFPRAYNLILILA